MKRHIILHMFQYPLLDIVKLLPKVKEQGFTDIQITPIQPLKEINNCWWIHYQPIGFRIGNELIGNKEDLILLCNEAEKYKIGIIADVVLNHTAGATDGSIRPHEKVDKELLENPWFWKEQKKISNWKDRWEVTHRSIGLPGLNLSNYDLHKIIFRFLNELLECGVSGFRFDAAKNIELPDEGSDFWKFIPREYNGKKLFNYAEIIFESKELLDRYSKYVNILSEGTCSDRSKMVAFFESHDSYLEFGWSRKLTEDHIIKEWEILLKNSEWSVLYYCRPFTDWWMSDKIKELNYKYN